MDPRVARTKEAVLASATELLVEGGPTALTVDGVVARSGVAKSTVYRHWATREDLVVDVLASCLPQLEPVEEGTAFHDALLRVVDRISEVFAGEQWKRVLPSLLMLRHEAEDDPFAALDERVKEDQSDIIGQVLRLGVDEGVLPAEVLDEVDLAVVLLVGPLLMAGLAGDTVDPALPARTVRQFLAGYGVADPS